MDWNGAMDSISWPELIRSGMWIAGLGVALAAGSHASWRASVRGARLGQVLGAPAFLVPVSTGLLLIAISLAWGATTVWERGLWIASGIALSLHVLGSLWWQRKGAPDGGRPPARR